MEEQNNIFEFTPYRNYGSEEKDAKATTDAKSPFKSPENNKLNSPNKSPNKRPGKEEKVKRRLSRFKSNDSGKKKVLDKYAKKHEEYEIIRIKKLKELFDEEQYFQSDEKNVKHTEITEYMTFIRSQKEGLFHSKYDLNSTIQFLLAVISIFCAITHYEVVRTNASPYNALVAQWFCFASSVMLWMTILFDNYIYTEIEGINRNIKGSFIRYTWSNILSVAKELGLTLLHPNPLFIEKVYNQFNVRYERDDVNKINSVFVLICFLRFFYVVKMYLVQSDHFCPRTARIGRLFGLNLETFYALKAILKAKPYETFILLFISIWAVGMYTTRIFEVELDELSNQNYSVVWNALWSMFMTMTTVGYGDKFPNTIGGRIIGILNCFMGAFLISLGVSTFTTLLNFESKNEETNCRLIERISLYEEKQLKCKNLVSNYLRTMNFLKQAKASGKQLTSDEIAAKKMGLYIDVLEFRYILQEINSTFPSDSNIEIYLSYISIIEDTIEMLNKKVVELTSKVDEYAKKYESLLKIENEALKDIRLETEN